MSKKLFESFDGPLKANDKLWVIGADAATGLYTPTIYRAREARAEGVNGYKDFDKAQAYCDELNKQKEVNEVATPFTKGEWYLQKLTDAYTNIIRCNNGKGHETLFIASTTQNTSPETRANARLMAAAPDLLEALQDIISITDRDHIACVKAKAAIEKATVNKDLKV